MYLIILGVIGVGAGLLLVYYSIKDRKPKKVDEHDDPKDKGKVIYLFDEDEDEKKEKDEDEKKEDD